MLNCCLELQTSLRGDLSLCSTAAAKLRCTGSIHMKRIDVAIAIVCRGDRVLICRRRQEDRFGGYWEFPGGKVEAGETIQDGLARELREELDIEAEPLTTLPTIDHDYPDIHVRLHPFLCSHKSGEPKLLACAEALWVEASDIRNYTFPPANGELLDHVLRCLRG
jgi:mutator protein MutT